MSDLNSLIDAVRPFASPELLSTLLVAAKYSLPFIGGPTIPYPLMILSTYLTNYAIQNAFNPQAEREIIDYLSEDYSQWLEKGRVEWQQIHPQNNRQQNAAPFTATPTKRNDFGKFERDSQTALIGRTNSGKTAFFQKFLLTDFIEPFDSFFLIEAGLNPKQAHNIRKAALYNMRITNKQKENDEMTAYYTTDDVSKAITNINSISHEKKKLVLFDDTQVNMSNGDFMEVAKYLSVAKNANATCFVSLHNAYGKEAEIKARDACRYFVLFNINEQQFNKIQDLTTGNKRWDKYNSMLNKYDRVVIYDRDRKELYDARDGSIYIPLMGEATSIEPPLKRQRIIHDVKE
jgi:hypothetical protein